MMPLLARVGVLVGVIVGIAVCMAYLLVAVDSFRCWWNRRRT